MARLSLLVLAAALASGAGAKKPLPGQPPGMDPLGPVLEKLVREYVRDHIEEEGSFSVEDEVLGRTWEATLMGVKSGEVRRHADGRVSVCADFKGEDDVNSQALDLDFYAASDGDEWFIEDVFIHKAAGKPRFRYDAKNERVPVKAKPGKAKAKNQVE